MAQNNVEIGIQLNFQGFDRKSLEREIERVEKHLQGMSGMKVDAEIDISEESLGRFNQITERLEDVVNQLNNVTRKLRTEDIKITVEGQAVKKIKNNVENAFQEGLSQANMSSGSDDEDGTGQREQRENRIGQGIKELSRNMDLWRRDIQRLRHSMSNLPGAKDERGQMPRKEQLRERLQNMPRDTVLKQFSGTRAEGAQEQVKKLKQGQEAARELRRELSFMIDTTEEGTAEARRLKEMMSSLDDVQLEMSQQRQSLERTVESSKELEKIVNRTERSQQEVESLIQGAADKIKGSLNDISSADIQSFLEPFSQLSRQLGQDLRVVQRHLEKVKNEKKDVERELSDLRKRPDVEEDDQRIKTLENEREQLKEVENALESQKEEVKRWRVETSRATDKLKSMQSVLNRNEKFIEEAQKSTQDAQLSFKEMQATFGRLAQSDVFQGENEIFNQRQIERAEAGMENIEKTIDSLRDKLGKIDVAKDMEVQQLRDMKNATRTVDGEERKGVGPFAEEGFSAKTDDQGRVEMTAEEVRQKAADDAIKEAQKKYDRLSDTLEDRLASAYEIANGEVAEHIQEMTRQSKRVHEVGESVKDLVEDVDSLKKNYNSLNSSTIETTQDVVNQSERLQDAKNEYRTLVKQIQKYEAQLESAAAAGDKQSEEVKEIRKELRKAKQALKDGGLSTDQLVDSGRMQAQAKGLQEVRDNALDTAQKVGQLEHRFEKAKQEMDSGGERSAEAAREMQKLSSEYDTVRNNLRRYVAILERAKQNGRELSDSEQELLRTSRELSQRTREQNRYLERNAEKFEKVQAAANRAGTGMGAYTDDLAESIKKNFQFISAIGIVASALFGLQMAFEEILEESRALTRAMTVMRSKSLDFEETLKRVKSTVRSTAVEFGERVDEVAEVVFQLGSAGLSTEESMAALDHTMELIVGTEAEAQEATKAVAGAFNVFGKQMDDAMSKSQKFQKITDTMIKVFREHQVEMNEVIQGLEFSSAAASAAGFSFQETAGLLAVLNDKMIKGGKAGRGLQNVMSKVARNTDKLQNMFGVEVDDDSPLSEQFVDILEQFREKIGDGALSVQELREQFKLAGLRGGRSFSILVQNVDEVKQTIKELEEGASGAGQRVRDIVEQSLIQSFEQAKQSLLEIVRQGLDPVLTTLNLFAKAIEQLEEGLSILGPFRDLIVVLTIVGGTVTILSQSFVALSKLFAVMANEVGILIGRFIAFVSQGNVMARIGTMLSKIWSNFGKTLSRMKFLLFGTSDAAKMARDSFFGTSTAARTASGSIGTLATTLGVLAAAIPIVIMLLGTMNTSTKELKRNMEQAGNAIDKLAKKKKKLNDFKDRLKEIEELSGGVSPDFIGDKLRKAMKDLGKDTINTTDLMMQSNERLGLSIDNVTDKLKERIKAKKELLKLQKEEEQQKFVENLEGRVKGLVQSTSGFSGLDNLFGFGGDDVEGNASEDIKTVMTNLDKYKESVEEAKQKLKGLEEVSADAWSLKGFLKSKAQSDLKDARENLNQTERELQSLVTTFKKMRAQAKKRGELERFNEEMVRLLGKKKFRKFKQLAQDTIEEGVKVPSVEGKQAMDQMIDSYKTFIDNMEVAVSPQALDSMINGFDEADRKIEKLNKKSDKIQFNFNDVETASIGDFITSNPEQMIQKFKDFGSSALSEAAKTMAGSFEEVEINQEQFKKVFLPDNIEEMGAKARDRLAAQLFKEDGIYADVGKQIAQTLSESMKDVNNRQDVLEKFENDGVKALQAFAKEMDTVTIRADKMKQIFTDMLGGIEDTIADINRGVQDMVDALFTMKNNEIIDEGRREGIDTYLDSLRAQSDQLSTLNEESQKQAELRKKLNKRRIQRKAVGGGVQAILEDARKKLKEAGGKNPKERRKNEKKILKTAEKRLKVELGAAKAQQKQLVRHTKMTEELEMSVSALETATRNHYNIDSLLSNQVDKQSQAVDYMLEKIKLSDKLQGSGQERQAALNKMIQKQTELIKKRRELIDTFKEETSLRYELIASGQELLNLDDEHAGTLAKVAASVSRVSALKAKENKIAEKIENGSDRQRQLLRMKRAVQQEIIGEMKKVLDIQNNLEEKQEKINQKVLDKRLSLMEKIVESMKKQAKEAEKQVSKGLERAFNTNPLDKFRKAGKLAQLTGRSIGATLADTKSAMDDLVTGLKDGRVSVGQFMSVVDDKRFKDWAKRVQGVNEDIDKMNAKMRNLRKKELKQAGKNFDQFIQTGNLEQARKAFERVSTLSSDMFKGSNPELFQDWQRQLIGMRKQMGKIAKTKTQKRLEKVKKIAGFVKAYRKEAQRIVEENKKRVASLQKIQKLMDKGKMGEGLAIEMRSSQAQKLFKAEIKKIDKSMLQISDVIKKNTVHIRKIMDTASSRILEASRNILKASTDAKFEGQKSAQGAGSKAKKISEMMEQKKEGGYIPGFGGGDKIPAQLEKGEFVMPKEAVSKFGVPFFEMLRRGQVPKFAEGGSVSNSGTMTASMSAPQESKNTPENMLNNLVAKLNKQMDSIEQLFKDFVNDNALVNFFLNEFPEKYEEGVNEIVGMLSGALDKAISNTTEMIDSFADAWDSLDESLEDISEQFEKSVEDAQTGLRRNKSSYFQYLDSVHQAEEERIQARLKAEKKYREALKEIEREFAKNVIGFANEIVSKMSEGVSKIPGLITKGLGAGINQLTKTFQDEITTGVSKLFEETLSVNQGAISKSVGVDKATVGAVGVGAGKVVGAGITAAVKSLETTFKTLTNALLGALSKLFKATVKDDQELINRMDQFINDLPSRLDDISNRLSGNIKDLANTFVSKLPEIGTQFISGLSTVLSSIGDVLLGDQLQNAVNELLEKLPTLLSQELLPALNRALRGLVKLLPKVSEFVKQFFAQLTSFFHSESFANLAKDIGKAISEVITDIISSFSDIVGGLMDAAFQIAQSLVESLLSNLGTIVAEAVELLIEIISNISQYLGPVVISLVKGIGKAIQDILENLPKILGQVLLRLPLLIAEALLRVLGLKKLADEIGKLADNVGKLIKTLSEGAKNAKEAAEKEFAKQQKQGGNPTRISAEAAEAFSEETGIGSFHTGGLITDKSDLTMSSDEVPIIAQTGEGILSRKGMQALGGVEVLRQLNQGKNPYVDGKAVKKELRKFDDDKRFRKRRQESVPKQTSGANQIRSRSNISNNVENDNSTNITIEEINIASDNPEDAEQAADELVKEVDRKMAKRQQNNKSEFGKEIEGGK